MYASLGTQCLTHSAFRALLVVEDGLKHTPGPGLVVPRFSRSCPAPDCKCHYAAPLTISNAIRAAAMFFDASSFGKR